MVYHTLFHFLIPNSLQNQPQSLKGIQQDQHILPRQLWLVTASLILIEWKQRGFRNGCWDYTREVAFVRGQLKERAYHTISTFEECEGSIDSLQCLIETPELNYNFWRWRPKKRWFMVHITCNAELSSVEQCRSHPTRKTVIRNDEYYQTSVCRRHKLLPIYRLWFVLNGRLRQ
jgi:hypothetical protein